MNIDLNAKITFRDLHLISKEDNTIYEIRRLKLFTGITLAYLFASSSTSKETINNAYHYTDADVYRLLMSDNALGNRVVDIVQQYLEEASAINA